MDIHEASTDDVEAIRAVAEASWEQDYPGILSRETVETGFDEWYGRDRLAVKIEDPRTHVFVAAVEGTIVGFAHTFVDGEEGSVLRLYVHPDHRREGIGTALFDAVAETLFEYDIERLRSMVLADNDPGNDFYRELGFDRVSTDSTRIGNQQFEEHAYTLSRTNWAYTG